MHETLIESPTDWEASDGIRAAALRAEAWAGEPFLRPDDDPATALREGSAMRRALDGALAEMDAGLTEPSADWKVRYALMLGLERVLSEKPPHLASGTELRRHQVDALAGMLTELIAATEKANGNGNGTNGNGGLVEEILDEEDEEEDDLPAELDEEAEADEPAPVATTPVPSAATASAIRRRRARRSPRPASSRPPAPKAS